MWESVSAFPKYRMRELHITCTVSHASRLKDVHALNKHTHPTASERAWDCERELYFPCECRLKHREDINVLHTHTHTHCTQCAATERAKLTYTHRTPAKKARLVCFSLRLTSLLRLLFFSTFCRCWSAAAQSVENALLLCVVRAAAHRVAQSFSAHAQRCVACSNLLPIIVNCNWQ